MSTVGDILKSVREVLLLQSKVEALADEVGEQSNDLKSLSDKMAEIDKRVVRIETMIEMGARHSQQKQIED